MRHGVLLLPEHEWETAAARWRAVEELGFHHGWTYDHLMWRSFAERRWYASVPTLTAAAVVTSRIGLGMLVATPNFRHPAAFAKDVVTLDDIAQARLVCGLGSGAIGHDARVLGQPVLGARERADRFEAFVDLLDALLVDGDVTRRTPWFSATGATFHPRGRRPPFAVAAAGPRGMALAARHGQYWVTTGPRDGSGLRCLREALPALREQVRALDAACERVGRDPATLRRLLLADAGVSGITSSLPAYEDAAAELADTGFTDLVVHWPRPDHPYEGDEQVLADFAREHLAGHRS